MRERQSLNGLWQFQIDHKEEGESHTWYRTGLPSSQEVEVPHIWQRSRELMQYTGTAWYEKDFEVKALSEDRRLFLVFGAVDFHARVWVNGIEVGEHEGGFTPFEFDITDKVRTGVNRITVRVYDPQDNAEIPIGKQGSWYTRVSGIWQDVYLETRPRIYIRQVYVFPDVDRSTAGIRISLSEEAEALALECVVTEHGNAQDIVATTAAEAEGSLQRVELALPKARLWSPEDPHLYDLIVKLKDQRTGGIVDEYQTYFGMRKIAFQDGQLLLNGEPLFVRGALDQAYYPDTVYTAPSDEWIQREIRLAKEMGFNLLRKHIKIEIPRYLYWADRLGMLIWAEPPNTVKWSAQSRRRFRSELLGMIERDFNRPSIIIWSLYNEEWGLEWDLANDREKQQYVQNLYDEVKRIDPTRLICDNSGWIHVKTDINDYHRYFVSPEQIGEWQRDLDEYVLGSPERNFAEGYKPADQPIIISEFGVWGLPSVKKLYAHYGGEPPWFTNQGDDMHREDFKEPLHVLESFQKYKLDQIFGDFETLAEATQRRMHRAVKSIIEEMRKRPEINGYVVTEFTDVEWETNGWLDYMRDYKIGMDRAADFNAGLIVMADGLKRNLWCGETLSADIVISNHDRLPLDGMLSWELEGTDCSGSITLQEGEKSFIRLPEAIRFTAPELPAAAFVKLKLRLTLDGGAQAANEEELTISPFVKLPPVAVCAYGMSDSFRSALEKCGARIVDRPEAAQVLITSTLDETVLRYCRGGGYVLFLAEEGDRLTDKDQFTFRELAPGESWDRTSSFNYVDPEFFAGIPMHPEMGWEFDGLFPDYVVPFSNYHKLGGTIGRTVYMFGNEQLLESSRIVSGYFQGWIGQVGGSLLVKAIGQGQLTLVTWKLKETYGKHPIATQIVNALIEKAISV